jgi:hypothetical protein
MSVQCILTDARCILADIFQIFGICPLFGFLILDVFMVLLDLNAIPILIFFNDLMIVYNKNITNIDNTLNEYIAIHPKIKFTMQTEKHNTLNYWNLKITNNHNKLTFSIYRKPTNTDLIIHNDSCHPYEYKKSAITYLVNRMTTYPIAHENRNLELNFINEILTSNHYRPITNVNQHNTPKNTRCTKN